MKTGRLLPLTLLGLAAFVPLSAASEPTPPRLPVILRNRASGSAAIRSRTAPRTAGALQTNAGEYSAELPEIARIQGRALYRSAVDITNNTANGGVTARVQYTYHCLVCSDNRLFRTTPIVLTLRSFDNFHSDDFVQYLDSQGLLVAGAVNGSFGSLLVFFQNLPSAIGWEGTVVARTYNRLVESDPSLGTVAYAYPGSLFFESAHEALVATIHDTTPAPTLQGSLRTNLGVRNTDIHGSDFPPTADRHASVRVTFTDVTPGSPTNGQIVGNTLQLLNLQPGEVSQFSDVFAPSVANIPSNVTDVIALVEMLSDSAANVTIEGFVNITDNVTQDSSFFEMKCADIALNSCGQ